MAAFIHILSISDPNANAAMQFMLLCFLLLSSVRCQAAGNDLELHYAVETPQVESVRPLHVLIVEVKALMVEMLMSMNLRRQPRDRDAHEDESAYDGCVRQRTFITNSPDNVIIHVSSLPEVPGGTSIGTAFCHLKLHPADMVVPRTPPISTASSSNSGGPSNSATVQHGLSVYVNNVRTCGTSEDDRRRKKTPRGSVASELPPQGPPPVPSEAVRRSRKSRRLSSESSFRRRSSSESNEEPESRNRYS